MDIYSIIVAVLPAIATITLAVIAVFQAKTASQQKKITDVQTKISRNIAILFSLQKDLSSYLYEIHKKYYDFDYIFNYIIESWRFNGESTTLGVSKYDYDKWIAKNDDNSINLIESLKKIINEYKFEPLPKINISLTLYKWWLGEEKTNELIKLLSDNLSQDVSQFYLIYEKQLLPIFNPTIWDGSDKKTKSDLYKDYHKERKTLIDNNANSYNKHSDLIDNFLLEISKDKLS